MIRAIAQSAKLLSFVLLWAFVFQTIIVQAEHTGAIACVNDAGKTDSGNQDQAQTGDECCNHAVAIVQSHPTLQWSSPVPVCFDVRDDVLPDGPSATIDQPPRVA